MKANHGAFSIVRMARVFSVSPSGFYAWKQACAQPSPRKIKRKNRDERIKLKKLKGSFIGLFHYSL
jgi:hypothetical protein